MKITKIECFNDGEILKIYTSDIDFYFFNTISQNIIDVTNESILIPMNFNISCAIIC